MRTALFAVMLAAGPALAEELSITRLEQYTDNRGWNEAGLGPTFQLVVMASITPAGYPTLVYAERNGRREPLTHLPMPRTPELYALWLRFDPAHAGSWRIVAERNDARSAPADTPGLANPWQVPLLANLRVAAAGAEPRLSWTLPELNGRRIARIRVVVRGEPRVLGRFMSVLFTSDDLPPSATGFTVPPGVLAAGARYVFQVMLDHVEGGELRNRSSTFSDPYTYR